MIPLRENETVILLANPGETAKADAEILRRDLLSADEREGVARLVGAGQQHERTVARALVRLALSEYFPVAPNEWKFARDRLQKPFVIQPQKLPAFQFSLSHTRGLIAVLITRATQGGVDVEQLERSNDLALVATKICAASELESLNRLAGDAWRERFFELWTLKEAYAKARGLGLSLPWENVAFHLDAERAITVRFGEKVGDDPRGWNFSLDRITPAHILASAVRDGADFSSRKVRVAATNGNIRLEAQG